MNAVRFALSFFIAVLIVLSAMGWVWTGVHQPTPLAVAGRAVLALGALAGVVGLVAIWRRPRRT
jgi:hypothetical protein